MTLRSTEVRVAYPLLLLCALVIYGLFETAPRLTAELAGLTNELRRMNDYLGPVADGLRGEESREGKGESK